MRKRAEILVQVNYIIVALLAALNYMYHRCFGQNCQTKLLFRFEHKKNSYKKIKYVFETLKKISAKSIFFKNKFFEKLLKKVCFYGFPKFHKNLSKV